MWGEAGEEEVKPQLKAPSPLIPSSLKGAVASTGVLSSEVARPRRRAPKPRPRLRCRHDLTVLVGGARLAAGRRVRALATQPSGRAWCLPEPIGGYRIGWFVGSGLVIRRVSRGARSTPSGRAGLQVDSADRVRPVAQPARELRRGRPHLDHRVDRYVRFAGGGQDRLR